MKEIQLTEGYVALVDDEDWILVARYTWRVDKRSKLLYAIRHVCPNGQPKTTQRMHRLIAGVVNDPTVEIDHIDHNGLNNQKANLRYCTRSENLRNGRKHLPASSRFKGVGRLKGQDKWHAKIRVGERRIHLGTFVDEIEAARAYDAAAKEHFGEFACINFPDTPVIAATF